MNCFAADETGPTRQPTQFRPPTGETDRIGGRVGGRHATPGRTVSRAALRYETVEVASRRRGDPVVSPRGETDERVQTPESRLCSVRETRSRTVTEESQ